MKYSTLWLSLLAVCSAQAAEEPLAVGDYALQQSKPAKTERWSCKSCERDEGWFGEVGLGAGYANDDGATRFRNWVPSQQDSGMLGIFNADLQYRGEGSRYGSLEVKNLGMERFSLATEQGHYDGMRARLGYSESPFYWSSHGRSVYQPGESPLTQGSLAEFDKEVVRKKLTAGLAYTPKSPWRPYADFSHEKKEATLAYYQSSVPGIGSGPGLLPKSVDGSSTTLVKSGVSYLGEGWLVDLAYNGSLYRTDDTALYYGSVADPYANERAYEPDNNFHQLSLSGQYNWDRQSLTGRVLTSQATSNGSLTTFRNAPITQDDFHGEVSTLQADAKWVGRFGRDLTLRAGGEYRDRKDKSDEYAVVGKQRGKSDRTRSKADLAADYRLSRSVKLTTGYQYKADQREQADRQDTDEHTLFLKGRYRPAGALQLGGKLAWSTRDGSDWRHDSAGGNGSPTLRQFYLADRDRVELRGDLGYQFSEGMDARLEGWWARDDYKEPDIGRSEGKDYGLDLTLNQQFDDNLSGHLFSNLQWITSSQNHAYTGAPDWDPYSTAVRDEITTLGLGLTQKKAFDRDLELGLDYSFAYGRGKTDASKGYDYPDLTSKQHRLEGYALYQLTKQHSLRWDVRYEYFQDVDYLYTGEERNLGNLNQDYNGYFTAVSWLYKF
ncbi:MtrB/PioB family decaheme-associated outer membrane protein [Aeromonas hydrophila]|uniref:MtrB/PioB family decaheme-associated outer membrane protein n=1 Tax=Aeromonas hydrophila TaxID=644 RepID=UPI002808AD56|nr:MtrB/PioB family decaheme-associated outer membrane protein [Aeromonas hydrophila]